MDCFEPKARTPNPRLKTNLFFRLFFAHTRRILRTGFNQELREDDIYEVLPAIKSKKLGDNLENQWEKLVSRKKPSVLRLVWKSYGKEYFFILLSLVIPTAIYWIQPKLVKGFISYFSRSNVAKSEACLYGLGLILVKFMECLYIENYHFALSALAFKMRSAFTSLIYRQILETEGGSGVGKTIGLITRDVNEFEYSIFIITNMFRDVLMIVSLFVLVYTETGWLALMLLVIVGLILLPDTCLTCLVKTLKLKTLRKTDQRYETTKEVLSAVKIIKLYLWSDCYTEKVSKFRKSEVRLITKIHFWFWAKRFISDSILKGSWYILVVTSIFFGSQLNASTLFLLMAGLNMLHRSVKLNVSIAMQEVATIFAVFSRIEKFLTNVKVRREDDAITAPAQISFSNFGVPPLFHGLNFEITSGIIAITGPVACGKTTLLKILAKEPLLFDGAVQVHGSVSYASQEPWLFPSTIKQNILFGSEYDGHRYLEVLRVCALSYDLQELEEGDRTIVGDRGANLSKGQQVRINLARAVYKNCDIYLLDDCLSNLDGNVAAYIFQECFKKFLSDKIVIASLQNVKHVTGCDFVLTLGLGEAKIKARSSETLDLEENTTAETDLDLIEDADETTPLLQQLHPEKRIYSEWKAPGSVKFATYKKYIQAGGSIITFTLIFFLNILIQYLQNTTRKLESRWVTAEQIIFKNLTSNEDAMVTRHKMMYVLPILLIGVMFLSLLSTKAFWSYAAKASISLHNLLFARILNATMEFFDTHLIGIVINRFSEDLLYIDENVPETVLLVLTFFIELIGIIILLSTIKTLILLPWLLLTGILLFARVYYLKTGRALKRLEVASRSPLLGHISATVEGLPTIRCSKNQHLLREEFDRHLDQYTSCSYILLSCEKAFHLCIHFCGISFTGFVIVYFLIVDKNTNFLNTKNGSTSVGDVGLVLSQAMVLGTIQYLLYRSWATLENYMITVERTLEYTNQPQENKKGFVVEKWPQKGEITFANLSFSYPTNHVLHDLNFTIRPKEKILVVGRTGSGKTSMIAAFLRLYPFKGKIVIDNVDTTTVPLDFLRSKISVIPQDPILFSGTLRDNIDPTRRYTDEEIWTVIKTVRLSFFQSLDEKIDSILSAGQKQLICLCRALIRRDRIVILDEITANVDEESEAMIHDIIRQNFGETTLMMISHKLNHVLDFDRVLVLDKGRVVEFDEPTSLLEDKNGTFHKMYKNCFTHIQ